MNTQTYLDSQTHELVYFIQEKGLWSKVTLMLSKHNPTQHKFTPARTTERNLGTILTHSNIIGLKPCSECIEYAVKDYLEGQRLLLSTYHNSRKQKIAQSQEADLDWIEGARRATKL